MTRRITGPGDSAPAVPRSPAGFGWPAGLLCTGAALMLSAGFVLVEDAGSDTISAGPAVAASSGRFVAGPAPGPQTGMAPYRARQPARQQPHSAPASDPDSVRDPAPTSAPAVPNLALRSLLASLDGPAEPARIRIPALGLDRELVELAVAGDTLQVPDDYGDVGWWADGPAPGKRGAAVVVGHVDTPTGPAVFYRLSGLSRGDRVVVSRDDGSVAVFEVRKVALYDHHEFPSAKVYRFDGTPGLNLLTCGGNFDRGRGQYTGNVVVFTDLVHPRDADQETQR